MADDWDEGSYCDSGGWGADEGWDELDGDFSRGPRYDDGAEELEAADDGAWHEAAHTEEELQRQREAAYFGFGGAAAAAPEPDEPEETEAPAQLNGAGTGELSPYVFTELQLHTWDGERAAASILQAPSLFEVLGLRPQRDPDPTALRSRFKRLSLLVHPDKFIHPDAAASFQKLALAMKTLSDKNECARLCTSLGVSGGSVMGSAASAFEATEDLGAELPHTVPSEACGQKRRTDSDEASDDDDDAVKRRAAQRQSLAQLAKKRRIGGGRGGRF
eukprot:TRINITY_DN29735_c0_g1_i1.p1 TRINITY_DN29735_c0_g1~~TRINITY_DN29735_c0_g1_i1.p1  ORF type:complete len:275 (+),score=97.64 TRINITY_DN29735_c0_g1_i1:71-895(+)